MRAPREILIIPASSYYLSGLLIHCICLVGTEVGVLSCVMKCMSKVTMLEEDNKKGKKKARLVLHL